LDPLAGGTALAEDIMPADSIDTWENVAVEWYNGSTAPRRVAVRTLAQNASGNVYWDWEEVDANAAVWSAALTQLEALPSTTIGRLMVGALKAIRRLI